MNPTQRAREASTDLLDFLGVTQRRAAEVIGMSEKRLSERIQGGTLFLRDFLELAHAEGGADFLRMMADLIDAEDDFDLPVNAAMGATEAAADTQGTIRKAREDGTYCHWEVQEIRKAVERQHAAATKLKRIVDGLEPGPVPNRAQAAG